MQVIATFQRGIKIKREEEKVRDYERVIKPGDSMVIEKSSSFMFVLPFSLHHWNPQQILFHCTSFTAE